MWNAQFHSGPRDQVVHTIHAKIHSPIREFLSRILLENKNNYRGYNNILKGIAAIFVLSTWLEQVCRALFCLPVLCVQGICWGRRKRSFQVVCYSREKWKALNQSTQTSVDLSQRVGMFRLRMAWVLGGHYTSLSHPVCLEELMVFYKLCQAGVDFV